jgi:hypothetical protein
MFSRLQVNVKSYEIDKREFEILGRRVTYICHKRTGIGLSHDPAKLREKKLDSTAAVPSDGRPGNLISDHVTKYGRMVGTLCNVISDAGNDRAPGVSIF